MSLGREEDAEVPLLIMAGQRNWLTLTPFHFVVASECSTSRQNSKYVHTHNIFLCSCITRGIISISLLCYIFCMHGSIVYIDLFDSKDLLLPRNLS